MTTLLLASLLCSQACTGQPGREVVTTAPEAASNAGGEPIAEYVVTAFTDSKGGLWFGTMGNGVAHYDPSTSLSAGGHALTFLSPADGEGGNVVSSIAEDTNGTMWFAGHDGTGVCKYEPSTKLRSSGQHFTRIWKEESAVRADRQGNIWASTSTGVFRYDGQRMDPFDLPIDRSAITVYGIRPGRASLALQDSQGNLWFRTDGAGAFKYDGKTFTHFTKADGLCSNSVNAIVEDDGGHIWFICMQAYQPAETGDGGLCRYDGKTFTTFPDIEGLHHNDLYTLFKDRSGNIWIGATGVGAYRYDGSVFTLFNRTDRPDLNGRFGLQGLTQDLNGTYWCGFSGGLFRLAASAATSTGGEQFVNVTRDGPWE